MQAPSFYIIRGDFSLFPYAMQTACAPSLIRSAIFGLINFLPFFSPQIFYYMRKLTTTKTKLVITRMKRGQTPPKLQMEIRNSTTASAWAPALACRDANLSRQNSSSILRKDACLQLDRRQTRNQEMSRCRSVSTLCKNQASKSKFIRVLPTIQPDLQSRTPAKPTSEQTIHEVYKKILMKFKENGTASLKNGYYTIHHDHLLDLVFQIIKKNTQQDSKANNSRSEQSQISQIEPDAKMYQTFSVYNQYSFHQSYKKERELTHHSRVVDQHHLFQEATIGKQTFWRIAEEYQSQPTQQKLLFLLGNLKQIRTVISQRQAQALQLGKDIEQISHSISRQQEHLGSILERIAERSKYLQDIELKAKQMQKFVDRQPNRILQQQAKEYKERQQELFDLAFLYQQQFPSSVPNFIHQSIMIPYESFKLTIQSFSHQELSDRDYYSISKKSMDEFKASLKSAYESTIEKLSVIIQKKASKIKNFVGIMRRLASYTIGKREYLGQINKKMSVVSIHIDKNLKNLQGQLTGQIPAGSVLERVDELRQLFQTVKTIYCQAEVFY